MEKEIEIKNERPPVWDSVCAAFNMIPDKAIFTYGTVIYNPGAFDIADHLIEHERVHMQQQNHSIEGAELWWGRFLRDPIFRIDQEARAYARQYDFLCRRVKDWNQRNKILLELAGILAGPLYNHTISRSDAVAIIKKHATVLR